uniref:Uncharacterized protein n=1 Tax=Nelumbo nucifera TaxID=4432 RepID=A0A822ZWB1_NELNU|nr:TPA_asm: hypothetical protein HUJ06_017496 [Nelumbo nucifera]
MIPYSLSSSRFFSAFELYISVGGGSLSCGVVI